MPPSSTSRDTWRAVLRRRRAPSDGSDSGGAAPATAVGVASEDLGREADLFAWLERLLLIAGIVLFVALVRELGLRTLWYDLRAVGYGLIAIIGQEALVYLTNTLGWRYAFPPAQRTPRFGQLLTVRFVGDVINSVTPTATVGGELIRARLLRGHVDSNAVWASIAVAAITQAVGQAAFVIGGLLVVLPSTPLPDSLRVGLLLALFVFLTGLTAAVLIQRRGMLTTLNRIFGRVRIALPAGVVGRMRQLDAQITEVYARPQRFVVSATAFCLGWALGTLEVYLILHFLGVAENSWRLALTIEVLSVAIDGALFFVPGKIGTQEGGKVLIFTLLGLPPAKGLALGVIRRVRDLSWSALGLVILSRYQLRRAAPSGSRGRSSRLRPEGSAGWAVRAGTELGIRHPDGPHGSSPSHSDP